MDALRILADEAARHRTAAVPFSLNAFIAQATSLPLLAVLTDAALMGNRALWHIGGDNDAEDGDEELFPPRWRDADEDGTAAPAGVVVHHHFPMTGAKALAAVAECVFLGLLRRDASTVDFSVTSRDDLHSRCCALLTADYDLMHAWQRGVSRQCAAAVTAAATAPAKSRSERRCAARQCVCDSGSASADSVSVAALVLPPWDLPAKGDPKSATLQLDFFRGSDASLDRHLLCRVAADALRWTASLVVDPFTELEHWMHHGSRSCVQLLTTSCPCPTGDGGGQAACVPVASDSLKLAEQTRWRLLSAAVEGSFWRCVFRTVMSIVSKVRKAVTKGTVRSTAAALEEEPLTLPPGLQSFFETDRHASAEWDFLQQEAAWFSGLLSSGWMPVGDVGFDFHASWGARADSGGEEEVVVASPGRAHERWAAVFPWLLPRANDVSLRHPLLVDWHRSLLLWEVAAEEYRRAVARSSMASE